MPLNSAAKVARIGLAFTKPNLLNRNCRLCDGPRDTGWNNPDLNAPLFCVSSINYNNLCGWYAAPDGVGYRNFSTRYRARYNQDPVRTATLAYDAVALVAALVKTQGPQRFSQQMLTNPSGFTGIDGLFRFRTDGTNERGLAVLRVSSAGAQTVSPALRSFGAGSAT